jgi:CO/xanthine dehydrogenase Mo-binding subunit
MPLEGKGVYARWDEDEQRLRIWSSTQTTTGVRAAVAAKLDLPLANVDCVAPDVGGGFGVKIVHPWPEEVLVPWAARELGRDVKWTEDRREHSSKRARAAAGRAGGFDDEGRILGLDFRFWHDSGATPYGIIVPIITSTEAQGLPGQFWSLYTNTVSSPRRGAGRPRGMYAMEHPGAIADAHSAGTGRGAGGN